MFLVDTNILLRFLTKDDLEKAFRVKKLLEMAEKENISLYISEGIVDELVFVLSSKRQFALPRNTVSHILISLISIPGVHTESKTEIIRSLEVYSQTKLDFVDCLLMAKYQFNSFEGIFSYDTDFENFGVPTLKP